MATKVNYFKIGIFVIGSIAVLVGFFIALGLGSFGRKTVRFETYIDESVHGLTVGSPVKHRGVDVGTVDEITFVARRYDLGEKRIEYNRYVLVVIAADQRRLFSADTDDSSEIIDRLIERGLRIRLTTQALTGISYLETDYFNPAEHPPMDIIWEPEYKYIPATQSTLNVFTQSIDQTLKKIESVDFVSISENLNTLLTTLNATLQEADITLLSQKMIVLIDELRETNDDIKDVIQKSGEAIEDANIKVLSQKTQTLIDNLNNTAIAAGEFVADFKDTNLMVQEMLKPKSEKVGTTIPQIAQSMDDFLYEAGSFVRDSRGDISGLIEKLDSLSSNLAEFSSDIKRDPGILLFSDRPARSEVVK